MLAIGKRLLPRAIDRNRVKRVAREAWRLRVLAQPALARELSVFIRLQKRPAVFGKVPDSQVKAALRVASSDQTACGQSAAIGSSIQ